MPSRPKNSSVAYSSIPKVMNWSAPGAISSTALESARRSPESNVAERHPLGLSHITRDLCVPDGVVGVDQEDALVAVLVDERLERVAFAIEALDLGVCHRSIDGDAERLPASPAATFDILLRPPM
jgi:hypothetical protein